MKISECYQEFCLNYLAVRLYSDKTLQGYNWVIHSFKEGVGDIESADLSEHHIGRWTASMQARGNSQSTIVSNLSRFKVFAGYLLSHGYCTLRQDQIYIPRKPFSLPKRVSVETVEKMMDAALSIRDKAIISLLFSSGVRNAELRNLTKNDISGLSVYIREGKGMRDRITYMDQRTRKILDCYLASRVDNCHYLFVTTRCDRVAQSTLRYIINSTAERAGVGNVHPHMFRHGIATHLMSEGMPSRMIQKMLGHSFLSTTEIYMHVSDTDLLSQHSQILSARNHNNN